MIISYYPKFAIAISGAGGYIGSAINNHMNHEPQRIDFSEIPVGSSLIHLAANVDTQHGTSAAENVMRDARFFDLCVKNKIHLIYASTNNVYPLLENCKVSDSVSFNDLYSWSKICSEKLIEQLNLSVNILRIADVFGVRQRHGNFFRAMERSLRGEASFMLTGGGSKVRSYIYIEDLCRLLIYLGKERPPVQIANVCYQEALSLMDIVKYLGDKDPIFAQKISYQKGEVDSLSNGTDLLNANVRTMVPTRFPNFEYRWDAHSALEDYQQKIKDGFNYV